MSFSTTLISSCYLLSPYANILATKSHSHKINTHIMQIYGHNGKDEEKKNVRNARTHITIAVVRNICELFHVVGFFFFFFLHIQFIHRLYIFMQRFRLYGVSSSRCGIHAVTCMHEVFVLYIFGK